MHTHNPISIIINKLINQMRTISRGKASYFKNKTEEAILLGMKADRLINFSGDSLERLPGMQEAECSHCKALLHMLSNCGHMILK